MKSEVEFRPQVVRGQEVTDPVHLVPPLDPLPQGLCRPFTCRTRRSLLEYSLDLRLDCGTRLVERFLAVKFSAQVNISMSGGVNPGTGSTR